MSSMNTTRASLEEVLDFANEVRKAGGGNPLDALLPAVPEDGHECLIAKNLNFNCTVGVATFNVGHGPQDKWYMSFAEDKQLRDKVADKLKLQRRNWVDGDEEYGDEVQYIILLPNHIGQVASDFDRVLNNLKMEILEDEGWTYKGTVEEDLAELAPYIERSTLEAWNLATIVKPDGSIVI